MGARETRGGSRRVRARPSTGGDATVTVDDDTAVSPMEKKSSAPKAPTARSTPSSSSAPAARRGKSREVVVAAKKEKPKMAKHFTQLDIAKKFNA